MRLGQDLGARPGAPAARRSPCPPQSRAGAAPALRAGATSPGVLSAGSRGGAQGLGGPPKPEIVWKKDGQLVVEGRRHVVYEDEQENFVLKILFCKQSDCGLYTCTASNLVGQTYSSVLVVVPRTDLL